MNPATIPRTKRMINQIHDMRRQKMTLIEIAEKLNTSYSTISRVLEKHPLPDAPEMIRPKPAVHNLLTQSWFKPIKEDS